nr:MAG TPA_asm: hypothetical protein [Caudoviricetes sp.]
MLRSYPFSFSPFVGGRRRARAHALSLLHFSFLILG